MKLTVSLPYTSYDVTIEPGGLTRVGSWVASLWTPCKIAVITDDTVSALYGEGVTTSLTSAGFEVVLLSVSPGENSKTLDTASQLYDRLGENEMSRSDGIISLGGGVIGDLSGFVASTYMRGLKSLQIPTTLLAQVDSSIGGKTGVNTEKAKNMVGTFHQPDGVLIDSDVLQSLDKRQIRSGLAEIIKTAAIGDITLWELLDSCEDEQACLARVDTLIYHSCQVKRRLVEEDERDNGQRLLLNFGHTVGHAIERSVGYGQVTHGEAVAIGMVKILELEVGAGNVDPELLPKVSQMLEKFGLPTTLDNLDGHLLYQGMSHDKKMRGKRLSIVTLAGIGEGRIRSISLEDMALWLKEGEIV